MKISVKVITGAKESKVEVEPDLSLRVRLKAKPIEGRANQELIEVLAKHFSCSKSKITLIKGFKSRDKVIEIN